MENEDKKNKIQPEPGQTRGECEKTQYFHGRLHFPILIVTHYIFLKERN